MNNIVGKGRGGNPFHRVPLLLTTKDSEGVQVAFMPGGPRILDSQKKDTVICMTLDAEGREIPVPFTGDLGVVLNEELLPNDPPDGLLVILQEAKFKTEGQLPTADPNVTIPEVFLALKTPFPEMRGYTSISFESCTFGEHTEAIFALFLEIGESLEMGISGPVLLLINDHYDPLKTPFVYIRVWGDYTVTMEDDEEVDITAGWNFIEFKNDIWVVTKIVAENIPPITNAIIGEIDHALKFASTMEWVPIQSLKYSFGGGWHDTTGELPPFISFFPECDGEDAHTAALMKTEFSRARYENGETQAPKNRDIAALVGGFLNVSNTLGGILLPAVTPRTTAGVKLALESEISAIIVQSFGYSISITFNDFSIVEGDEYNPMQWDGVMCWTFPDTGETVVEPYKHDGVSVYFENEGD